LLAEGHTPVKLAAGDMLLYPASTVHRVTPVTRGIRMASFFWIQSMVRDHAARTMLFDLDRSIQELSQASGADAPALIRLTGLYHNLLRRWAEL
jgi:predicted 2-oxoglutarate/Fe(II)-dependent dioxygenase YbiX